jgi:hypothetical protein
MPPVTASTLNATEWETIAPLRTAWERAPHGKKGPIVDRLAEALGVTYQTAYRKLTAAGAETGRKRRSDAGTSSMTLPELQLVAGVLMASRRDTGKTLLTIDDALAILAESGQLRTTLHPSQVSRLLRQHNLHPEQLAAPEPSVRMRSLHPNHVWQLDSSVCVLYYLPNGRLASMDADAFYRNKPTNIAQALKDLCTRYAVTDHWSGAHAEKYYLGGESAETVVDFLTWCIWKRDEVPFHGAPRILMLDPGPGNKSRLMANLANRLDINLSIHAAGAARVNGQVENMHQRIERHFEGRLRFVDRAEIDLDRLNALLQRWSIADNSSAKHSRHGEPRYSMWMRIQPEQLRVAASLKALRDAATREPVERTVANDKRIPFGGRAYDLTLVPGVAVGQKVLVAQNPFRAPAIDVRVIDRDTGEEHWQIVEPELVDEAGFPLSAPVIGEGHERRAAFADQDHNRGRLLQEAYRVGDFLPTQEEAAKARKAHAPAYAGIVNPMADVDATPVPAYLPRAATPLPLAERRVEVQRLTTVEAAKRLRELLGEAYTPQVFTHLATHHASGVPEDQLGAIAQLFQPLQAQPTAAGATGLRLVSGDR